MKEDFLHLVWQYQYFDRSKPREVDDELLTIIKPGYRNRNSGPDFLQATLRIGGLDWVGSVEIHVCASEWNQHGHQHDAAYQSVVLHVVWEKDAEVRRLDGSAVPTLELKSLVPLEVILRYRQLMEHPGAWIPCEAFLPSTEPFTWINMQERVLVERLERKATQIHGRFETNQKDWLETLYQTLAWSLGLKQNADAMQALSEAVPLKILAAGGYRFEISLPILLGMAGFLEDEDGKPTLRRLHSDFVFYQQKYSLEKPLLLWQKFRLRPASFPLLRIVLLARILPALPEWFQKIEGGHSVNSFFLDLSLPPVPDWLDTLLLETNSPSGEISVSEFIRKNMIINVFSPFLTAMSLHRNQPEMIDQALAWLTDTAAEQNAISRQWKQLGIAVKTSAQSQSMVELYTRYCQQKRCMSCSVGNQILGKTGSSLSFSDR